jgi:hypothetical protein
MKKRRKILLAFVSLAILLSLTAAVKAQVINAGLNGTVNDATGNVVQNATVTITNVGTNAARTVTTDASGSYSITELPPGMYSISVEATGFSKTIVKDLELNVGAQRTVNVELRPGQVTETVEVTSDQNIVETTRSDIGHTITPREIENLPLLNRTFAGLSVVAPEARGR